MLSSPVLCPELVGRDTERAALGDALARLVAGQGGVVLVTGEPGVGKTRLLREVTKAAKSQGITILRGAALQQDSALPFGPLLEAFADAGAAAEFEALVRPDGSDGLDAAYEKRRLFERLLDDLLKRAAAAPLVLALEDLHWADPLTLELLGLMARRFRMQPVLAIGTTRSAGPRLNPGLRALIADLERERLAPVIRLNRLGVNDVAAMVSAIFGGAEADQRLVDLLWHSSEGLPFFVEEILRSLADDGRVSEGAELVGEGDPSMTESLRDIILRRLEELDEDAWVTVSAAAVMGRKFALDEIAPVVGFGEERLLAALRLLVQHQLIEETGDDLFMFRHALIRDAVHASLIGPERRRLHRLVAEAMLAVHGGDEAGEHLADLAHHFREARDVERARTYAARAADHAASLFSWPEAGELYKRALVDWPMEDIEGRARMNFNIGRSETWDMHTAASAVAHFEACARLAEEAGDFELQGSAERHMGWMCWILTDVASIPHYRRAIEILDRIPECTERAWAYASMTRGQMLAYQWEEATVWGMRALELAGRLDLPAVRASVMNSIGMATIHQGHIEEGLRMVEEALSIALSVKSAEEIARGYNNLLFVNLTSCSPAPAAAGLLEAGVDADIAMGQHAHANHLRSMGAGVHVQWGRWAEARQLLDQVLASEGDILGSLTTVENAQHESQLAFYRGDWERAIAILNRREILAATQTFGEETTPLQLIAAQAQRWLGRLDEAAATLAPALAITAGVTDVMMSPFVLLEHSRQRAAAHDTTAVAEALAGVRRVVESGGSHGGRAALCLTEATAATLAGDFDSANTWYRRAVTYWAEAEYLPQQALALVDLALFALARRATAERAVGTEALAGAREILDPLGSRFIDRALDAARLGGRAEPFDALSPLTARERQVLAMLGKGAANAEIAEALVLSERTVERHLANIYAKLGLQSRAEAIIFAARTATGDEAPRRR